MSKTNIQTNLLGRICTLTEEAKSYRLWHDNHRWNNEKGCYEGDFAKLPGGKNAQGEIVAVYLVNDGNETRLLAAVRWAIGGNLRPDIDLTWLRVL